MGTVANRNPSLFQIVTRKGAFRSPVNFPCCYKRGNDFDVLLPMSIFNFCCVRIRLPLRAIDFP